MSADSNHRHLSNQPTGPRSKGQIEHDERRNATERAIDDIYGDYLAHLGTKSRADVAIIYARYSTRHQDSIADQVRSLLSEALRLNLFVPRDLIFFDLAIRGVTKQRYGLNLAETALRQKRARNLLLFSTSRLFRKTYRTLEFVDRIHKGLQVRCIFVQSGIDTNDRQQWEAQLQIHAVVDQFSSTANVANIQAAHEGQLRRRLVFGTLALGYTGEAIEGQLTKRGRPQRRIVIDLMTARIVLQMFEWFVTDRMTISEIVRRLNSTPGIPLPPCCCSGLWTKLAVKTLLNNPRYRGLWRYGVKEAVYLPEQDYSRQRTRTQPLAEEHIEDLRIVSDELWYGAERLLASRANQGGRPAQGDDQRHLPKLLNGFLFCPKHGQRLQVNGTSAGTMQCLQCSRLPVEDRSIYSSLNRELVTRLICEALQSAILGDPTLPRTIVAAAQAEAVAVEAQDPRVSDQLRRSLQQLDRSIAVTRQTVGESAEDQRIAQQTITDFQRERGAIEAQLRSIEQASNSRPMVPAEDEVQAMLSSLASHLMAAATSVDQTELGRARAIVEKLTGGMIEIHQMGEKRKYHGWLQARFNVSLLPYLVETSTGRPSAIVDEGITVVVDIRDPGQENPKLEKAWQMFKADRLYPEIAAELECTVSNVRALLKKAAKKHGEAYVDGRKRRVSLQEDRGALKYVQIAPAVMKMVSEKVPRTIIAKRLAVNYETVQKAISWWHTSRGLPVPSGRPKPSGAAAEGPSDGADQAA